MISPIAWGLCLSPTARAAEAPPGSAPPGIVETANVRFPPALEASGYDYGEVRMAIKVDAAGRIEDLLVTAYTRKPFADEAVKAVRTWTFEPSPADEGPAGWVRNLRICFQTSGGRVVVDNIDHPAGRLSVLAPDDAHFNYEACALRDLDRIPAPRHVVAPEGGVRRDSGPVVIEFYIDEQGRVRLPGVRDGEDAAFANAALDAVAQWTFDPPTRGGMPVLVRASQTFRVKPAAGRTGARS